MLIRLALLSAVLLCPLSAWAQDATPPAPAAPTPPQTPPDGPQPPAN